LFGGKNLLIFFQKINILITIPKNKKQKTNMGLSEPPFDTHDMPSKDYKQFLVEFMVKFYEQNSTMTLESKFVCYGEESINKFKTDI